MESLDSTIDIETRRMELRGVIRLAGEVIAQYWPMRTFVHHNPLHSLEYLPFEETVRRGKQFLGGNGYLPSHLYREYLRSGRIQLRHLDTAITPLVHDKHVTIGSRKISHGDVLRACLAEGLCTPTEEPLEAHWDHDPHHQLVESLADRLASVLSFPDLREKIRPLRKGTRPHWVAGSRFRTGATRLSARRSSSQINSELIKWCEAFLDEGHATWPMPGREKGLYGAWKALAAHEWSPCGIADSRKKISRLPDHPEDALLESLDALAIPTELRQDYLSLQLTALPGWAGFIKWRAEEREYAWQRAYPVGLVKYLAIRLWYAQELVQKACRDELGIDGQYRGGDRLYAAPCRRVLSQKGTGRRPSSSCLCRGSRSSRSSKEQRLGKAVRPLQDGRRAPPGTSHSAGRSQAVAALASALHIDPAATAGQFTD